MPSTRSVDLSLIPIVITIDVEPDELYFDVDNPCAWDGLSAAIEQLTDYRTRFQTKTGTPFHLTWLVRLDAQVEQVYGCADWPLTTYSGEFQHLQNLGDEIGIHVHPYRWQPEARAWIQDYADEDLVLACTEKAFETYARHFGRAPFSSTYGFSWMSNAAMRCLDDLGVGCDLSIIPRLPAQELSTSFGQMTGAVQDCRELTDAPYYPSTEDFRVADSGRTEGIIAWPLTVQDPTARPGWKRWARDRWRQIRGIRSPHPKLLLREGPLNFAPTFEYLVRKPGQQHLQFQLRASSFVSQRTTERIFAGLDYLLEHPSGNRLRFATVEEGLSLLGVQSSRAAKHRRQAA